MSYYFNGSNQYLSLASDLGITDYPFTMCCWFKPDALAFGDLCAFSEWGATQRAHVRARDVSNQDILTSVNNGTSGAASSTTDLYSASTWQHAAIVASSTTARCPYLDGSFGTCSLTDISYPDSIDTFSVGYFSSTVSTYYFAGYLAEVAVWSTDLSSTQMQSLAGGTNPQDIASGNLVFYAPLVDDLVDDIGALTFTNNNSATQSGDHPTISPPSGGGGVLSPAYYRFMMGMI